jgi:hypothetical protein
VRTQCLGHAANRATHCWEGRPEAGNLWWERRLKDKTVLGLASSQSPYL